MVSLILYHRTTPVDLVQLALGLSRLPAATGKALLVI